MIKKASSLKKREIDLSGPDGNAFVLLGIAKDLCRQLKLDWNTIQEEMTASDYENLIKTFDKYFGEYVDLVLPTVDIPEDEDA